MAGAHRIDIVLLHKPDIPYHVFPCHSPSPADVELMAVDSLEDNPFSVEIQELIPQFKMAEPYGLGNYLYGLSGFCSVFWEKEDF